MQQRAEKIAVEISRPAADDELMHDLCNGLTGVLGAIQIVRDSLPEGSPERKRLDLVVKRLERSARSLQEGKTRERLALRRK
jgi:hypothetical protein